MKIIPEALTVQEGDSARFVCNVQSPRPTQVLWSRRGATALPKRATVEGNVLSFTSLQISDRGVYLCTATNDIALRTAKASLIVNGKFFIHPQSILDNVLSFYLSSMI